MVAFVWLFIQLSVNSSTNPAFAQENNKLVVHIKSGNPENKD